MQPASSTHLAGLVLISMGFTCFGDEVAQNTCRNLNLYPVEKERRFVRHIIKNVSVNVIEECSVQCFMESTCVSYNLGPEVNGKRLCELSDSDHQRHPNDLVQENGYGYWASKNPCVSSPCPSFTRCLPGFGVHGFECVCLPGFTGNLCQDDIDECADQSHNCSPNATCTNTIGSFSCKCVGGYLGDGLNCTEHPYGLRPETAGKSCKDINNQTSTSEDKEYWINANFSVEPFKVFCDMTTDGGGWTLIKRTLLSTDGEASLLLEHLPIKDYRGISNYSINHQTVTATALGKLRTDMGFDQLRIYCFKKAVGRVFHIKTALNDLGEAVVHSNTIPRFVKGDLGYQPIACGSFETFNDDTSVLSQNCTKWGETSKKVFRVNRWSKYLYPGEGRLYQVVAKIERIHAVRMFTTPGKVMLSCDERGHPDEKAPLSRGDVWKVFVR